jgi:hypothetical protein
MTKQHISPMESLLSFGQNAMNSKALVKCRRELAGTPELWQFDLLDTSGLSRFATDLGIKGFDEEAILGLWNAGLLRADLIKSKKSVDETSIRFLSKTKGEFTYVDVRKIRLRKF